jgi:hemerythrin superfamily protein
MATRRRSTKQPDAIEMLIADHKRVAKLFKEFEKVDHEDAEASREIVEMACAELKVHTTLEEEIFYPAVREALGEEEELLNEAEIEHASAKELIAKLEGLEAGDAYYTAAFTVLAEYVRHHVKEEQNEMFPKVKKSALDLDALAEAMRERKEELMGGVDTPGQAEPTEMAEGADEPGAGQALRQARGSDR